jgi:hypothetical protein
MAKPSEKRCKEIVRNAIDKIIALFPEKTQNELAAALRIKSPSISGWRRRGMVPLDRIDKLELISGGVVTRHELEPRFPWD